MKNTEQRGYAIDSRICYTDYETYCDTSRRFGFFSDDGDCYTITDQDTPRQWLNMLFNDKFISVTSNKGEGYTAFGGFYNRITKYYNREFYIVRNLDGKRIFEAIDLDTGETVNLFDSVVGLLTPTTPRCPHLGCALKYNRVEHTWDCPCHGSRFDDIGHILNAPAVREAQLRRR